MPVGVQVISLMKSLEEIMSKERMSKDNLKMWDEAVEDAV